MSTSGPAPFAGVGLDLFVAAFHWRESWRWANRGDRDLSVPLDLESQLTIARIAERGLVLRNISVNKTRSSADSNWTPIANGVRDDSGWDAVGLMRRESTADGLGAGLRV